MSLVILTRIDLREERMKKIFLPSVALSINEFYPPKELMWCRVFVVVVPDLSGVCLMAVLQVPQFAKLPVGRWLSRVKLNVFNVFCE